MPRFFFAIFTLLVSLQPRAWAQVDCAPVTGLVVDSTGGLLPRAKVTLDGAAKVTAGSDGRFAFACVRSGHHTVLGTYPGFAAYTVSFTAPHAAGITLRLLPATEASVTVNADGDDAQVPAPGGGNGLVVSGRQLQALADDPDDLLRELQQLAAGSGGSASRTTISVDGFQDDAKLPPKDSIAFINVSPDLFSAEYREPPFGGGRVEVYTKPGAKAFHGAVFLTNSSAWMNARDPFTQSTGTVGKQRYGFDLSGPVRKQGSNFSVSLEHRSIDELAVVNATTFDAGGNSVVTRAAVPQPQRLWEGQARVDWQLGPKNIAFVTYSANVNHTANVGVGGQVLAEAGYDDGGQEHTLRASDVTTVSPKLVHEARVSFDTYLETDVPQSLAPSVVVSGYFTRGGATIGNSRQRRYKLEFDDDIILNTKRHLLKAGVQFFNLHRNSDLLQNFNGQYIFASPQQYFAAAPEEFSNVSGNPRVQFNQVRSSFFYQDNWKVSDKLTFAYGLRYFFETLPDNYKNAAPRLGFIYTPDKKQKWVLKTHFGLFNGQYSADEAQELLREDGVERVTSLVYKPVYGAPLVGATPIHSLRTVAPGSTNNTYAIGDASVSRDLPFGFNVNVEEVFLRFLTYARTVNINSPLGTSVSGVLDPYGPRPLAPNVNIMQVNNNGTGQGHGEFLGISNFARKRAQFFVGVLHLNIRDNTDDGTFFQPQSAYTDAGEQARRDNEGVWQVFGNASVNLPWKVALSSNGYASGGQPFNLVTGADNNGDGSFNDRPQYAAAGAVANGSTVFATPFGLLTNAGAYVNGVPQRPILRDIAALPWSFHLDANLQRAWVLNRDPKAERKQMVTANIRSANFLNHTNVTAEGSVPGSPQFLAPVAADTARRVEFGLRYSF